MVASDLKINVHDDENINYGFNPANSLDMPAKKKVDKITGGETKKQFCRRILKTLGMGLIVVILVACISLLAGHIKKSTKSQD